MNDSQSSDFQAVNSNSQDRGTLFFNQASLLGLEFDRTGFRGDLEKAVRFGRLSIQDETIQKELERHVMVFGLGALLKRRYDLLKDLDDLKEAVAFVDEAIKIAPQFCRERMDYLENRALWSKECYECTSTLKDLEKAVNALAELVQVTPSQHAKFRVYIKEAASLTSTMFLRRHSLADWIQHVLLVISLINHTPQDLQPGRLVERQYRTDAVKKLSTQINTFQHRISGNELEPISRRMLQSLEIEYISRRKNMGFAEALADIVNGCLDIRFDVYGGNEEAMLNEMDECYKQAASFGLSYVRTRFRMLDFIVNFSNKDELPEGLAALTKAIHSSELALKQVDPEDGKQRICTQTTLLRLWTQKFNLLDDLESLNRAIHYAEAISSETGSRDYPDYHHAYSLRNLAGILRERFKRTGVVEDLDKAVEAMETAVAMTAADAERPRRAMVVFELAKVLKTRYQTRGLPDDLDRCLASAEDALSIEKIDTHEWARMLSDYALMLRQSFRRSNAFNDINKARQAILEALEDEDFRQNNLHIAYNNLCLIMQEKYERSNRLEDLTQSIHFGREALSVTTPGLNGVELNLANSLVKYYDVTGVREHLDEAILHGRKVMENLNPELVMAAIRPSDLGEMLRRRGQLDSSIEDLDEAISLAERATAAIPANHPLQAMIWRELGASLGTKMQIEPLDETLHHCINAYVKSWECDSAAPSERVHAAWYAAKYLLQDQQNEMAAEILSSALRMMPMIGTQWTERSDQQHRLTSFAGLAADAALALLQAGKDPDEALQMLELGRGMMISSTMVNKSDVTLPTDSIKYPELLREYNLLRLKLDVMDPKTVEPADTRYGSTVRKTVQEIQMKLDEIRRLPGAEGFLLPPKISDLTPMASDGPVIFVVTSSIVARSAAIILTSSGVTWIPLPNLKHNEVIKQVNLLSKKIGNISADNFASVNENLCDTMLWLWKVAVEPILGDLGFTESINDHALADVPHVKWIPVGLLNRLPFHAAGDYTPQSGRSNTMNRVVSSYLTTIRTLTFTQLQNHAKSLPRKLDSNLLVVSMPETPNEADLPSAREETSEILKIAESASVRGNSLEHPNTDIVLRELPLFKLVHFACHGVSDYDNPSNSHLILNDGKLSIIEILRSHIAEPEIAFLSACSTAQNHDAQLADESIHIASSFQQIGFRHVVGTLWSTDDGTCLKISQKFYSHLLAVPHPSVGVPVRNFKSKKKRFFKSFPHMSKWAASLKHVNLSKKLNHLKSKDQTEVPTHGCGTEESEWKVADALHYAIKNVSDKYPNFPLIWAPYVLFGG